MLKTSSSAQCIKRGVGVENVFFVFFFPIFLLSNFGASFIFDMYRH